jgi:uncharacterized cupredoxin-like copper-binding protein
MPIRLPVLVVAAMSVLSLGVGCGDDDSESGGGATGTTTAGGGAATEITIIGKDNFSFEPNMITMTAGEAYTLALMNAGVLEHDFTVDDPKLKIPTVPAGRTGKAELTVEKPGSYEFYCSVPGHKSAGMTGTLTVS